jgi:hypothetical protein
MPAHIVQHVHTSSLKIVPPSCCMDYPLTVRTVIPSIVWTIMISLSWELCTLIFFENCALKLSRNMISLSFVFTTCVSPIPKHVYVLSLFQINPNLHNQLNLMAIISLI